MRLTRTPARLVASCWRVAADDGSTVAYAPEEPTARLVAAAPDMAAAPRLIAGVCPSGDSRDAADARQRARWIASQLLAGLTVTERNNPCLPQTASRRPSTPAGHGRW
jgi:hypothetical protein